VNGTALTVAFTAGMLATFNPCGFAMLPAYLSYFLGLEDASPDAGTTIFRAIGVGATVSAGFLVVFAAVGAVITVFSLQFESVLPWVTIAIGIGLAVLGVTMLRGFEPTVSLPKLNKGTNGRQLSSMFLFGVSYAVASLSCTIGVFLATVSVTFTRTSFWSGVQVFAAYALGMALVLMFVTVALALARQSLVKRMRSVLPYVNRVAGGLLVVAGLYLAYYGWYELRVNAGALDTGGPARLVFDWNTSISGWVQDTGAARIGLVLGGALVAAAILAIGLRSARAADGRAGRGAHRTDPDVTRAPQRGRH
jgi:cytochrome c biogenesis protein CcdA